MHILRLLPAHCTDCLHTTILKRLIPFCQICFRQIRDSNPYLIFFSLRLIILDINRKSTRMNFAYQYASYTCSLIFCVQILGNKFIPRSCYKSYSALSRWPYTYFVSTVCVSICRLCASSKCKPCTGVLVDSLASNDDAAL